MKQPKKCSKCGYVEDANEPWMPFYDIGEKNFCGMCINLALLFQEECEKIKAQGFEIVTHPRYKCTECETPSSEKHPQFAFKGQSICVVCLYMALEIKWRVEEKTERFERWQKKILN